MLIGPRDSHETVEKSRSNQGQELPRMEIDTSRRDTRKTRGALSRFAQ